MSAFIRAMDAHTNSQRVPTTNGALQVALHQPGTVDGLTSLFVEATRGGDPDILGSKLAAALASPNARTAALAITFLFQLRDVRGGKGERNLFVRLFNSVVLVFPATVRRLVPLIPMYGRYKDLVDLWINTHSYVGQPAFDMFRSTLVQTYVTALRADAEELVRRSTGAGTSRGLSLAAKWLPGSKRKASCEGTPAHAFRRAVRGKLYGSIPHASMRLRKLVSASNRALKTTESLMSAGQWGAIDPSKMPSGALHKYRLALLYEDKHTGMLRGADPTRIALRKQALAAAETGSLHAGTLDAHQIARRFIHDTISPAEAAMLDGQWRDILATVQASLAALESSSLNLGNVVAMVDVSASMTGTPLEVAIALGLLVSSLAADPFKHRVLTFETAPTWVTTSQPTLAGKVHALKRASWGGSTDFLAAFELILESLETASCEAGRWIDPPTFITFSDMQFDQARTRSDDAWATTYETMKRRFNTMVARLSAKHIRIPSGISMPVQIFWNLSATTTGLVTDTDREGVIMLSGYNQNLLKLILQGQLPACMSDPPTPKQTFLAAMADSRYDAVRQILDASREGALAMYRAQKSGGGGGSKDQLPIAE